MTTEQWLAKARADKDRLRELICNYHPIYLRARAATEHLSPEITAVDAERACEVVRAQIQGAFLGNPELQFDAAIRDGDVETIMKLLSAAWFGVPESTTCWRIPGFAEAVDLLDDPPDLEFSE